MLEGFDTVKGFVERATELDADVPAVVRNCQLLSLRQGSSTASQISIRLQMGATHFSFSSDFALRTTKRNSTFMNFPQLLAARYCL